ncbi:hypothetical protein P691DRAFT_816341 [Macrolepiota fuliginosa MF-IS2]|uniref:Nephrocystin 3-like N-terminal domain-containing protein n=1 Tax=Macrolepiota fuliginosa MF-IS2 TaxID=1400762 RepID=A0A9P5WXN3_9AGAR|nr:hypothetical protein P691DRAFT_816341 [Macrolepiota fuliginosa MF-IS2]
MSDTDQTTNHSNAVPSPALIVPTTSSVLTGAHHFTIDALTAITQNIDSGVIVLQQLKEKAKPAAMHDSSARAYPPRCHPGTRKRLRSHIGQWGIGKGGNRRMLWVLGPAAVGKSAVAQATAEEFDDIKRFGAGFFFSRPNHIDNPNWVIPTIAYQLVTKHRQYKHIITQLLIDDPLILEKNRQVQFRKLIIEPFRILMTEYPDTVREPLLIILDGLDECEDKEAQVEFIDLISTHVRQVDKFPLRWMICSRPEWHLQTALSNSDFEVVCERQELKCEDRLPNDWPDKHYLFQIDAATSGHLGFASFILRFIDDDQYSDPDNQLNICIKFLSGGGTIDVTNPLHALDPLYRQILSSVPASTLPITKRILGFLLHRPNNFSADDGAKFLNIDQTTFCRALQNLHSVICVPSAEESHENPLRFYHASFSDFLNDSSRSGNFCLDRQVADGDFTFQCLYWIENHGVEVTTTPPPDIIPYFPLPLQSAGDLVRYSVENGWRSCCRLSDDIINRLEGFSFGCITSALVINQGLASHREFAEFLLRLYSLGSTRNKSLITLILENSQEPGSISERMQTLELETQINSPSQPLTWVKVEYQAHVPEEYIASFIPDIDVLAIELPFTLRLRLGKAAYVYISLEVDSHPPEGPEWEEPLKQYIRPQPTCFDAETVYGPACAREYRRASLRLRRWGDQFTFPLTQTSP